METIRPKSSGNDLKIFTARVVETLSRSPKSGRSCLAGSASANAGNLNSLVERPDLAQRRRNGMARFSQRPNSTNNPVRNGIGSKEYDGQHNSSHRNSNSLRRLESRQNFHLESTVKTYSLGLTIPQQESKEAQTSRSRTNGVDKGNWTRWKRKWKSYPDYKIIQRGAG